MTLAAVDSNIVTMLATVVTASVFSIGLVSHRMHLAAADARRRLRDHPDEEAKESALVADLGSDVVIVVNVALAALVVLVAGLVLRNKDGLTTEDKATLGSLMFIELAVVVAGWIDQRSVKDKVTKEAGPKRG